MTPAYFDFFFFRTSNVCMYSSQHCALHRHRENKQQRLLHRQGHPQDLPPPENSQYLPTGGEPKFVFLKIEK